MHTARLHTSLGVTAAIVLVAACAHGAWSTNAGRNTVVCTATGEQRELSMIPDGNGGAVMAWIDLRAGQPQKLYVQRVNSNGDSLWTSNGVLAVASSGTCLLPLLSRGPSNTFFVVWSEDRATGNGLDLYCQLLGANGQSLWVAGGMALCTATNGQVVKAITCDTAGSAVMVWLDQRDGRNDFYFRRMDLRSSFQVVSQGTLLATNGASGIAAAPDGAGGAIVAWDSNGSGIRNDIYAQRIGSNGAALWGGGVAVCTATQAQSSAAICSDGAGGAIIAWADPRRGTESDIYAQRVDNLGTRLWTANGIAAVAPNSSDEGDPRIVPNGAGGALISCVSVGGGIGESDILLQSLNSSGTPLWGSTGSNVTAIAGQEDQALLVPDGQGGGIVSWNDARLGDSIFAQRMNASGQRLWAANGVPVGTNFISGFAHLAVSNNTGGLIVGKGGRQWNVNLDVDILAQAIDSTGKLGSGGLWAGAADLGGGWRWLAWFGYFSDSGAGWIYHNEHHWMYAVGTTTADIWFYTADMGWLWTSSTQYPYLFRSSTGSWIWYQKGSVAPRWFYDMTSQQWEQH